jgi:hypothetical protein
VPPVVLLVVGQVVVQVGILILPTHSLATMSP